ncbi:PadR family transcriptional regulator [Leucobacter albus]|uniref:PadR family transcriptional regulator n=1 Tax=Leucobacter albus TaxID=272210 RepID=A0ABW3TPW6_9MICO
MLDDVTTQLRRGVVEFCVLGLLARSPMYGWQLAAALTERDLIASIGTLYPLLGRLRDRELIVAFEQRNEGQQSAPGGPTRKYYRLTPLGEEHLARFRAQWRPFTQSVSEIIEEGKTR